MDHFDGGGSRETLSALLNANRRTELIQLATDGFMLFVVADDKADVTLSRTTRSKFLRSLVIATNVEKRSFTKGELIQYTEEFAKTYDFDIEAIQFIDTFMKKGIIHFEHEKLVFSLPFIELYLLASELSLKPEVAEKYFQFNELDFDMATFDLYAEIGASQSIVEQVKKLLEKNIEALKLPDGITNNLLSEKIQPRIFSHPERVTNVQDRIEKAIHYVGHNNNGDIENKTKLLDLAEIVQEKTTIDASTMRKESDVVVDEAAFGQGTLAWFFGAILVGSGSEHLDGLTKRELAKNIVILSESVIHHWIEVMKTVDFEQIRKDILSLDRIKEILDGSEEERELEVERVVDGLVDALEMSMFSAPFRQMLNTLCEQAGQKVLLQTLLNVELPSELKVAELMLSLWAGDIDISKAKDRLKKAVSALPKYEFVRINIATHCLSRVYWNHWEKSKRLEILDFADETVRPLGKRYEKGAIKRAITSERKADSSSVTE